jgi:hypothetical protein
MNVSEMDRRRETPGWLLRAYDSYAAIRREGDLMSAPAIGTYSKRLEARLDTVGWGLLFLLVAALALPGGTAEYVSVAAVGGAMIVLNVARVVLGVPVRWLSVVLGASMAIAGGAALGGMKMDVFVLFFALAGAINVAVALLRPARP